MEVLLDSTFDNCRPTWRGRGLAPFLEMGFARFVFKDMDLAEADARPVAFFDVFDLVFAFVAIDAATYTRECQLKSSWRAARELLFKGCSLSFGHSDRWRKTVKWRCSRFNFNNLVTLD
jgi:hypothetical protein